MALHNDRGKFGEELAVQFLEKNGYEILDLNWEYRKAEIDIVALKDNTICFIEVKTRSGTGFGMPETFVEEKKQELLELAADEYLHIMEHTGDVRFDIISIILNNISTEITHLEDVF